MKRFNLSMFLIALAGLLPACTGGAFSAAVSTPAAPTLIVAPTATAPALKPSPTAPPAPTPSQTTERRLSPTSAVDPLAIYRQAMRPQFAADVDRVAARGASRYDISVSINVSAAASPSLDGAVQVDYTNTEMVPLSEVYFRLYPNLPGYGGQMTVSQVQVDRQPVNTALEAKNSALRVDLPQPLPPGDSVHITLMYQTLVPTQTEQGYNIFIYADYIAALSGFYPVIAVYDDEGWNIEVPPPYGDATYLDTSLYRVRLTVPRQMVVAASGSQIDSRPGSNGTKTLTLVSGPMRDFYIALSPAYQTTSRVVDGVMITSYYPSDQAAGGRRALQYAVDALRLFDQLFGPYPYSELDVVATPTLAGGVEYPGIIVLSRQLYGQTGGFFEHAVAHEVAHQWWYGVVGNDQVDEPWLDEALTNYSAYLYWQEVEGPDAARQVMEQFFWGPYERAKSQGRDRPVAGPVADFSESEYSIFVYSKGSLFFDALRRRVGAETFLKILQTYYREYKYQIASPSDLVGIIEQVSGQEIDSLYHTWIEP